MHRHLILDCALDDVLAVLAILRRDHLIGNEGYLAELELLGVLLELDGLVLFRVDSILSIANRLRGLVVSRVVQYVKHFLVENENQVAEKHAICIFFELAKGDLVHSSIDDIVPFFLGQPALINGHFV